MTEAINLIAYFSIAVAAFASAVWLRIDTLRFDYNPPAEMLRGTVEQIALVLSLLLFMVGFAVMLEIEWLNQIATGALTVWVGCGIPVIAWRTSTMRKLCVGCANGQFSR